MSYRSFRRPAAALGLLLVSAGHGQTAAPAERPDPLNSKAEVPAAVHRSVFRDYRPVGEVKVGSWRDANDTVTRIGGWRAYAREAGAPGTSVPAPAAPPPLPQRAASAPAVTPAAAGAASAPRHGHHGTR